MARKFLSLVMVLIVVFYKNKRRNVSMHSEEEIDQTFNC